MEYAYVGETNQKTFNAIRNAFPMIVGIGVDKSGNIIMGVPTNLDENAIGLYQLIVTLWDEKETREKVWELLL